MHGIVNMKKRKFADGGNIIDDSGNTIYESSSDGTVGTLPTSGAFPFPFPFFPGSNPQNGGGDESARSGLSTIDQGARTVGSALDRVSGSLSQASNAIGGDGGNSTFGSLLTAYGGKGGGQGSGGGLGAGGNGGGAILTPFLDGSAPYNHYFGIGMGGRAESATEPSSSYSPYTLYTPAANGALNIAGGGGGGAYYSSTITNAGANCIGSGGTAGNAKSGGGGGSWGAGANGVAIGNNGTSASANTGGGGSGSQSYSGGNNQTGGSGGSGYCVVFY